ncbi:MAG: redoxin, partial [Pirellulales bacterium]
MCKYLFCFLAILSVVAGPPSFATRPIRQGPQLLKPADHGVGDFVESFEFADIDTQIHTLNSVHDNTRLTVFCFTSTSCPLSRKYLPTLASLAEKAPPGVQYVLVNPIATDSVDEMKSAAASATHAIYVHDEDGYLTRKLGGKTTTDAIVLDAHGTILFHGAVDDQYGFGYALDAPRHRYLSDAIAAILDGKMSFVAATDAPGCDLHFDAAQGNTTSITYYGQITRILQRHCLECHRDGGIGPFPLETLEDVVSHAGMIETVVRNKTMPPWFADYPSSSDAQQSIEHKLIWSNDRSLATDDREALLEWLGGGQPAGNEKNAPAMVAFPSDWSIGTPDKVWEFQKPVSVKATGIMPYQYITVETHLDEPKWVQAIEIQPGNREVVHHVIVSVQEPGDRKRGRSQQEENGLWAGYVPGQSVWAYPDGYARYLPKGARLVFQMHYTPNGTATEDKTRLGVVFAKTPPDHEVRVRGISNHRITIPPGASRHQEEASIKLPVDVTVLGFLPHMHLRGTACRYEIIGSNGNNELLLDIPHYDFNWQLLYRYSEPKTFLAGDTLQFTAWYDNSSANPANPDPAATVRWGEQTYEEMMLGYVEYYVPNSTPRMSSPTP